ncbi:hypothetical protein ACRALDRAFT_2050028 [Sodiomyces alcalophilus JCM 7366]|uniref:uncharacterized protein n=1 Tax=Sodiomyces alcalophilus JCM 7366 TaxID=591952 RepID=UPI0039B48C42
MAAATTVRDPTRKAARSIVNSINTALERDASQPRSLPYNEGARPGGQSPVSSVTSFESTDQEDAEYRVGPDSDRRRPLSMPSRQDSPADANISEPLASSSRAASPPTVHHAPPPPPPPSGGQPIHVSSEVPRTLNEELRKIIRQEMAALHSQNHEHGSPADSVPRITPSTLMNTMFPGAYPSPPPSVTSASTSSRLTLPQGTSSKAANTSPTAAISSSTTAVPSPPQRPTVRFRDRGPPIVHSHARTEAGPSSPARAAAIPEAAGAEGQWGVLFDANGYSTQRLGQILRILADQVISEMGTPGGITVTPDKMNDLYTKYGLENDAFCIKDAFKPLKNNSFNHIEFLYRDLDCPYHLVQSTPKSRPSVPGLTPAGFAKWLTANILAYPDQEARRLNRLLADFGPLAIAGSDGVQERLPKTLPRHAFPASHDKKTRRILVEALMDCLDDHAASSQPRSPLSSSSRPLATPMAFEPTSGATRRMSDPERRHSGPRNRSTRLNASPDRDAPVARISRTQSDNVTNTRPQPPVGRYEPRSPPLSDRYITTVPNMLGISSLTQRARGGAGDDIKSVRSWTGRERRGDRSPRRQSLVIGGPTWGDYYRNVPTARVRGSSVERTPREYHGLK